MNFNDDNIIKKSIDLIFRIVFCFRKLNLNLGSLKIDFSNFNFFCNLQNFECVLHFPILFRFIFNKNILKLLTPKTSVRYFQFLVKI